MPLAFTQDQLALINLLLRIAVMAGITSLVLGFRFTGDILVRISVPAAKKIMLAVLLSVIFSAGILIRKMSAQAAMDLSLEGAIIAGLIGGTWVGAGTGMAIGVTCFLIGETASLPFYTFVGLLSGLANSRLRRGGEVWNFSLNPILAVYNFFERLIHRQLDRDFIPVIMCIGFSLIRYGLLERYGTAGLIYGYPTRDWLFITIDLTVTVFTVGISLKLAGNARDELVYREEEKQLVHARLTTLRSQINPHFLFNTLNSITSLIRTDAERAREMTRQLSSIFRKALDETGDTHTLESELEFLDDYLSIERVRFGDDKFEVVKEIGDGTLQTQVPSLLLQPLVENAVKHGIACRAEGGRVRIRASAVRGGLEIVIENDGPQKQLESLESLLTNGMGLRNVAERLDIYTCGEGRIAIESRSGGGAVVTLFIPESAGRGRENADTCLDRR